VARKLVVEIVGDASSLEKALRSSDRAAKTWGRDMERTTRGAIVGTGAFHSLGRSVAFASSAFLGGVGFTAAITSTIRAAEESQRVLGQTRVAVENSGLSWSRYRQHIEDVSKATSRLSGFDDERLLATFSTLVRRTNNVNEALRLNALAANVARGRNIELEQASQLVLKASIGNIGALRRLGINIDKNASSLQALDLLQRKYAGSAAAYGRTAAGAQDRFRVAIENLQEAIGKELLPSLTKYLNKGTEWLNQSKNQEKILRDTKVIVGTLAKAFAGLAIAIDKATSAYQAFTDAAAKLPGGKEGFLSKLVSGTVFDQFGDLIKRMRHLKNEIRGVQEQSAKGLFNAFPGQRLPGGFFGPPAAVGGAAGGGIGSATGGAGPTQLTAAQQRAVALAGTPSLTALRAQADYDKRALAFLEKRRQMGAINAKKYTDEYVALTNDLAQQNSGIQSILDDQARKVADAARTRKEAAKRAAERAAAAAKKALQDTSDSLSAFITEGLEPGFKQTLANADKARRDAVRKMDADAKKAAAAAAAAREFNLPPELQVAQARAEALGRPLLPILRKMRDAARKALASGKLSWQSQIDAYNEIASLNDQIKNLATDAKKKVGGVQAMKWAWLGNEQGWKLVPASHGRDLAAPLVPQRVTDMINARIDRRGPLLPLADARHPYAGITINGGLHLHGVQDVRGLENQLTRRTQQRPQTRRGPV
jgi:hypothetical protein